MPIFPNRSRVGQRVCERSAKGGVRGGPEAVGD
jgi:hypothetical protein